ncbi:MAG: type VII secretion target [Mycobacteriales bacterium]|nr:MAG: hypothetical protein DLM56_03345 [Pseudonocardiales bacterium]
MGDFKVDPADLSAAAVAVDRAVGALSTVEAKGSSAQRCAIEIHYEPAAGVADALAQKAAANLALARDALTGLSRGLRAAAATYSHTDQTIGAAASAGRR